MSDRPHLSPITGPDGLERLRRRAEHEGARLFELDVSFSHGGPWAGIRDLLPVIVPEMPPDLTTRHGHELLRVLPWLRPRIETPAASLMETAPERERVRGYPGDRALRIVHGLVDALGEWAAISAPNGWILACSGIQDASEIVSTLLAQLERRKGLSTGLTVVTVPGAPPDPGAGFDPTKTARSLEAAASENPEARESRLPDLVRCWSLAGERDRAARCRAEAFALYTSHGFYRDALRYGDDLLPDLDRLCGGDERMRTDLINKYFGCLAILGEPERALEIVEREGLARVRDPGKRAILHYLAAMLHGRYFPRRDLGHAEAALDLGIEELERAEMEEADRRFQIAFNRNGLALVRHFQGRPDEAIELCEQALASLVEHTESDHHLLHKSVLVYNVAQVHDRQGNANEALELYSRVIELDPEYSEYYNERGAVHLRLGHMAEAESDFLQAIQLSPPYPQVWTNLGQCYRKWGRYEEAVAAYDRALDLDPEQPLALAGRADALQSLGRDAEALADYSRAVEIQPRDWQSLGNRAVLRFEAGDAEGALSDLERALEIAPDDSDLRTNHGVALEAVGRPPRRTTAEGQRPAAGSA